MQQPTDTLKSIVQTAIQRELEAVELYRSAAEMVEDGQARDLLLDLAAQEQGHRNRLEALLSGSQLPVILSQATPQREIEDLRLTDYLKEVPLDEHSDIQQVLIVAGKREAGSHDLYHALAGVADDEETARLFEYLANQELEHKRRIERLYDDMFYLED